MAVTPKRQETASILCSRILLVSVAATFVFSFLFVIPNVPSYGELCTIDAVPAPTKKGSKKSLRGIRSRGSTQATLNRALKYYNDAEKKLWDDFDAEMEAAASAMDNGNSKGKKTGQ